MTHKTLSELWRTDRAAAIEIIDAIDRGEPVEVYDGRWVDKLTTLIVLGTTYRLAPRDPIIDWSQIGAEIVAFAMDENGDWYGYNGIPDFRGVWNWEFRLSTFKAQYWPKAFTPGINIPAEKSLHLRPKEGG